MTSPPRVAAATDRLRHQGRPNRRNPRLRPTPPRLLGTTPCQPHPSPCGRRSRQAPTRHAGAPVEPLR
eukprot:5549169-Lingulodinium_polyedra.AAC.1